MLKGIGNYLMYLGLLTQLFYFQYEFIDFTKFIASIYSRMYAVEFLSLKGGKNIERKILISVLLEDRLKESHFRGRVSF